MTSRERFLACVLGQPVDRPPFWLFWSPWGRAWQRWEREGKPAEATSHRALWAVDQPPGSLAVNCGPCPKFAPTVLSEDEHSRTWTDTWGIVRRDRKAAESMPEFLTFPVTGHDDWERYRRERLDPHHPDRLAGPWREQARDWTARGWPIQLGYFPDVGLYGGLRWLLGDEECLLAFYTAPELVHAIMDQLVDVYLTVFAAVVKEVRIDVIHIWEDMCGKQGPLISPAHWVEFMAPGYRRIQAFAAEHQIPVLSVDTDGHPDAIVAPMMDAGVNYLFPFEVAAGCDVNDYRRRYPTLAMMGGIDKRALAVGPAAIDAELDRVWPAVEAGRYIPDLDHLVPDDVSWVNYRYYADRMQERLLAMGG